MAISEDGVVTISGDLTFDTVNALLDQASDFFEPLAKLDINLENVTRSDSAGLALLVDWMRYAKNKNKKIVFHHVPTQLLAIANASGLDELLSID